MSTIATEIQRIKTGIGNAYVAIETMGGSAISSKVDDLSASIATIPTGGDDSWHFKNCVQTPASLANYGYMPVPAPDDHTWDGIQFVGTVGFAYRYTSADNPWIFRDLQKTSMSAFAGMSGSKCVRMEFPAMTSGGTYDFASNKALSAISAPRLSAADMGAFTLCSKLTNVDLPALTSIGNSAFNGCSSLPSASFPHVKTIGTMAFKDCTAMTSISLPSITTLTAGGIYNCKSLQTVNFPQITSIGASALYACSALPSASFPGVKTIGASAFAACKVMQNLEITACTSIGAAAFRTCSALTTVNISGKTAAQIKAMASFPWSASAETVHYIGSDGYVDGRGNIHLS